MELEGSVELFFREAVLEVTMGGLEGRARDAGRAAGTHTHTLMDLLDSVCGDCCDFSANSSHIISVSISYRNYVQYEFKNIMTDS